jgi:hypothetical protein
VRDRVEAGGDSGPGGDKKAPPSGIDLIAVAVDIAVAVAVAVDIAVPVVGRGRGRGRYRGRPSLKPRP